ncbi:HEAT repeat-containing PBS lyase [Candidatus Uabimicrobium amorphum]|uniref:HEAT repeat-containing PBS lyase n=1 Tax=Uabimicrobium amorphum TaxID=2596890 RepID=A0A5S9F5I1_UABAM|nr:HEAT repeat domain-containing protein [Candidatus Uabimicrobium amorphum]BBM86163.1 HEAT repeat-containing PBS lyase [Candidatus Uabimicrobium amorphum]
MVYGKRYLQNTLIFFVLFNIAFAQSNKETLDEKLKLILKYLKSPDTQLHFSALAELEKIGADAKKIRPELEKALTSADGHSKHAINYAVRRIEFINKKFPSKIFPNASQTKRSPASRISKNVGGLNILGVSNDFRQRLRYGKRHALVIGINKYNKYYSELDGPNYDAGEVASILADRYGFENVTYLCDTIPRNVYRQNELKERNPRRLENRKSYTTKNGSETIVVAPLVTKGVIEKYLTETFAKVGPNDAIFLFYAGHGVPGHIVATPKNKDDDGYISLTKLALNLSEKNAKHTLIVLDCCFGGSLLQDKYKPRLKGYNNSTFQFGTGENIDRVFARRSFQVISAGTGNEVVADKLSASTKYAQLTDSSGHSPFSALFLQALKGLVGRDDGIVLASDLGYYMMTTLTNDKRLDAKQTPRYGSLGGDGDFMFFPAYKVLNPKLLAPLYLSDKMYADFRSSGCEALEKFINTYSRQDQISLTKSALHHISKLLEDEEVGPRKAALNFITEKATKYAKDIKEFNHVVSALTAYFSYNDKKIDLNSFFTLQNQQDETDLYEVINCLGILHKDANKKVVDILEAYNKKLRLQWQELSKDKKKPQSVKDKLEECKELGSLPDESFQKQAHYYYQVVNVYRWLTTIGETELKDYENRMNLFLSNTEDKERKISFNKYKEEFSKDDFKKYFMVRDQYIRKEVLTYLAAKGTDLTILFELLKKLDKREDIKNDIAKDLENVRVRERAFLKIVEEVNNQSEKSKKLLFAFRSWKKKPLFELINKKLSKEDQDIFLPILAEENFNSIYSLMTDKYQNKKDIRSKAAFIISKLNKKERFIAHFFTSINERDLFDKQVAIDILTSKETVTEYSTVTILSLLLKNENKNLRNSAAKTLGEIGEKAYSAVPDLILALKNGDPGLKAHAAEALGGIGEKAYSAVPYLIPLLQNNHADVRSSTAWALGKIGEKVEKAVPDLITLLQDEDEDVKKKVAEALGGIGEKAHSAVPHLITLLQDEDEDVKKKAAEALGGIGEKAHSAVPHLITLLKNSDIQKHAAEALSKIGEKAVPALADALDGDYDVRISVAEALGDIGEKAVKAVPALILALKYEYLYARESAEEALGKIGEKAVPALILALKDQNKNVRRSVAEVLAVIGEAEKTVPALILALKDNDEYVRRTASWGLGKIGEKAYLAVPHLITLLQDKDEDVKNKAAEALGEIGEKAHSAVPHLILLLQDKYSWNRISAAEALDKIGEKSHSTVSHLIPLLQDKEVRADVAEALGKVGEKAVPHLILLLQDKDKEVRADVAEALGKIGEKSHSAVPHLIPLLQDKDKEVRADVAEALGKIGEKAHSAVPHLIPLLQDEDEDVRDKVVEVLGKIGEKAHLAIPHLTPLLQDKDENVRNKVVDTLGNIGKKVRSIVSYIIPLLRDNHASVRNSAVRSLGMMTKSEYPLVQYIIPLLKDKDKWVRKNATETLRKIGEKSICFLIPLLKDDDESVRNAAVIALGKIGESVFSTEECLTSVLEHLSINENWEVRVSAAELLIRMGEKATSSIILLLKDKEVCIEAARALERLGEKAHLVIDFIIYIDTVSISPDELAEIFQSIEKRMITSIIPLLKDRNYKVRCSAAKTLGFMKAYSAIPHLIPLLQDKDYFVRRSAARTLGFMKAYSAVPHLIYLLRDDQCHSMQTDAAEALAEIGEIGEEAHSVVPDLIPLLKDEDLIVRSSAAEALGGIGEKAYLAVPHLIPLLQDRDEDVRNSAAWALGKIEKKAHSSVPHLIPLLKDKDKKVRVDATKILGRIGAHSAVPHLIPLLQDEDKEVRAYAAWALGKIGEKAHSAVPHLIPLLENKDKEVRAYAAWAFGRIGKKAYSAVPYLIPLLQDEDKDVRIDAAEALGEIGGKAEKATSDLIVALKDPDKYVRYSAAEALGKIGEKAHSAVPHLIPLLKDSYTQEVAAEALGKIGKKAEEAVQHLIPLQNDISMALVEKVLEKIRGNIISTLIFHLKNKSLNTRQQATEALGKIGGKAHSAVPHLIPLLKDSYTQQVAAEALGKIGEKAYSAVPYLTLLLQDEDKEVRIEAAKALGGIGGKAEKATSDLIVALKDPDKYVRYSAAEALGKIGEKAHSAVPHLIPLLKDSYTQEVATEALGKIGKKAEEAVQHLIPLLKDSYTQEVAAEVLGKIGEKAHLAVPHLIPLLKYDSECEDNVREKAAKALRKIGEKKIPQIVPLLKNKEDFWIRYLALKELVNTGEKAVPSLTPLLKDSDEYVRNSAVYALKEIAKENPKTVISYTRRFLQEEKNQAALELLNSCVWQAYIEEDKSVFSQEDIQLLAISEDYNILNTTATIYAWQGNTKKANIYSSKAFRETAKRVKLLLEGKTPKQVEEEIKTKNSF